MVFIPLRQLTGLTTKGLPKKPKYGNKKVTADGKKFDSIIERDRYYFLSAMQREGKIRNLQCQVRFDCVVNGEKICAYVADFVYSVVLTERLKLTVPFFGDANNATAQTIYETRKVVEDVKGCVTPMFRIKAKLMKAVHGIEILIVKSPSLPI